MEKRIKDLEIEIAYLRKELQELKDEKPVEIHTHYHYDYSNMKPMILNNPSILDQFTDEPEM